MQPRVATSEEPADLGEEHAEIASSPGWHGAHLCVAEAGRAGDFLGNGFLPCLHSLVEMRRSHRERGLAAVGSGMQLFPSYALSNR